MLRPVALATLAFLCAGVAACATGGTPSAAAGGDWDLAGTIAAVETGPAGTRVTVDATLGAVAEPGRVVLLVEPNTEVEVRRADGTLERGDASDLVAGARIQAWHTGAEMRSLPPQYRATRIRVLSGS